MAVSRNEKRNWDIWLHEFSRGTSARLTSDPGWDFMGVWSPDGSRILFASSRDGVFNLYQKVSSGAGNQEALLKSNERKFSYDWSQDGASCFMPSWVRNTTCGCSPSQETKGGGSQPRWRRDGKELFYISADSKLMSVEVAAAAGTFQAGIPKVLFTTPIWGGGGANNVTRYDVTSDGKKFLINSLPTETTAAASPPITVVLNWQQTLQPKR